MGNLTQKQPVPGNRKKQVRIAIWSVVGTVVFIVAVIVGFNIQAANEAKKVYPLGDSSRLEYVGQSSYGCWLICDADPARIYYYATDMSPVEVARYFKGAKIDDSDSLKRDSNSSLPITTLLLTNNDGFYITYYTKGQKELDAASIHHNINDRHIISILSNQYALAKSALN